MELKLNQELFIVFREKKHEPETQRILAVFGSEQLTEKYIDNLRKNDYVRSVYNFFTIEEELLTDLPK